MSRLAGLNKYRVGNNPAGSGNMTAADLLLNKTGTNENGDVVGTMPENNAITITPSNIDQAIPAGHHSGSGKGPAVSFDASKLLTGTTVANTPGTMPNNGPVVITPSGSDQPIPLGYHNGNGKVPAVVVPAAKVLNDTTIAGQQGTMPNNGAQSATLDTTTTSKNIPVGYTTGGTVNIILEEKIAAKNTAAQDITPSTGKVLSKVTVNPFGLTASDTYEHVVFSGYKLSNSTTYADVASVTVGYSGTIRVRYGVSGAGSSYYGYGRILKNGVQQGSEGSNDSDTPVYFTQDITVNAGDVIKLQAHEYQSGYTAKAWDFSIKIAQPIMFVDTVA